MSNDPSKTVVDWKKIIPSSQTDNKNIIEEKDIMSNDPSKTVVDWKKIIPSSQTDNKNIIEEKEETDEKLEIVQAEVLSDEEIEIINELKESDFDRKDSYNPLLIIDLKDDLTLQQLEYFCQKNQHDCSQCILNNGKVCGYALLMRSDTVESLSLKVKSWIAENPPKSYLIDLKDTYPNIKLNPKYKIPNMCVKDLYGDCIDCSKPFNISSKRCNDCWRNEVEMNDV